MNNPEIERFAKDVAASQSLSSELKAVGTGRAGIVAFANAKGYAFSVNDVEAASGIQELSDRDLENVAGGIGEPISEASADLVRRRRRHTR